MLKYDNFMYTLKTQISIKKFVNTQNQSNFTSLYKLAIKKQQIYDNT